VLALGLGLGSCAAQGPSQSEDFHGTVVSIASHAAGGDFAAARAALDLLEAEVTEAGTDGDLDAARERDIRDAIALVRADLDAAEAASNPAPAPTPTTEPEDDDGPGNGDDKGGDKGKDGDKGKGSGKGSGKD
jgi:hypothetical protein